MIERTDSGRRLTVDVRVDAPADAVWKAITDPEQIRCWFPLDARSDAGAVGGLLEVTRAQIWRALQDVYGVDPAGFGSGTDACTVTLGPSSYAGHLEVAVPGRTLAARIPELDHALLFLEIESEGEKGRVGVWLSTYGLDDGHVSRLQAAVDDSAGELRLRLGGS